MQKNAEVVSVQLGEFSQSGHTHVFKAQIEKQNILGPSTGVSATPLKVTVAKPLLN